MLFTDVSTERAVRSFAKVGFTSQDQALFLPPPRVVPPIEIELPIRAGETIKLHHKKRHEALFGDMPFLKNDFDIIR